MSAYSSFLSLGEFCGAPISSSQFGQRLAELVELHKSNLPLPACLVVTKQALMNLALTGPNYLKLQQLLFRLNSPNISDQEKAKATAKLQEAINTQTIPLHFTHQFYQIYTNLLKSYPVEICSEDGLLTKGNIAGEVNILKGLLEIWAKDFLRQSLKSKNHVKLVPSNLLILSQPNYQMKGCITSHHPQAQHHAWLHLQIEQKEYWLDQRTWQFVYLPPPDRKNILNLVEVGQKATIFFRKYLDSYTLDWRIDHQRNIFFTNQEKKVFKQLGSSNLTLLTATKLCVRTSSLTKVEEIGAKIDGFMGINSEVLFHAQEVHPLHLVKRPQLRKNLSQIIQNSISKLRQKTSSTQLVAYRSYAAPTDQRMKLKYASSYETPEVNPFWGRRGPSLCLEYPQILEFELATIASLLDQSTKPLGLIIPWTRTLYEYQKVTKLIEQAQITRYPHLSLWWEINTPGIILNNTVLTMRGAGFIFNTQDICLTSLGIDPTVQNGLPNEEEQTELAMPLMNKLNTQMASSNQKLFILDAQFHYLLINHAIKLGWYGIITSPNFLVETKSAMLKMENQMVIT